MGISVEHILTRNLSEHLSTPVLLLDEAGKLMFFNEAAERIVGRPHDDLVEVGAEWPKLLHVASADAAALRRLVGPEPGRADVSLRVDGDDLVRFVAWAFPLIGREGTYLGSVVYFWRA